MSYQAQWGPKGFLVSPAKVVPFEGMTTAVSLKSNANNDTSGTPSVNTTGRDLQSVSFETTYSYLLGTDPMAQWEEWCSLIGQANPLYINGRAFGPAKKFQLNKVSMSETKFMPDGALLLLKLSLEFVEYVPPETPVSVKKAQPVATGDTKASTAASTGTATGAKPSTTTTTQKSYTQTTAYRTNKAAAMQAKASTADKKTKKPTKSKKIRGAMLN